MVQESWTAGSLVAPRPLGAVTVIVATCPLVLAAVVKLAPVCFTVEAAATTTTSPLNTATWDRRKIRGVRGRRRTPDSPFLPAGQIIPSSDFLWRTRIRHGDHRHDRRHLEGNGGIVAVRRPR